MGSSLSLLTQIDHEIPVWSVFFPIKYVIPPKSLSWLLSLKHNITPEKSTPGSLEIPIGKQPPFVGKNC